ncbi:MAG: hypothetical protein KAX44_06545 [Candidatus Brocadiae bacterium]|nr:hypothetical protein [Candidatus Brocadiia bacterium]
MARVIGSCCQMNVEGETVRAFIPRPLPPEKPPLRIEGALGERPAESDR